MLSVREISENIEQETLAPWAAKSSQAVRDSEEAADDLRTAFQRDRDRIIHSTPFRKLKLGHTPFGHAGERAINSYTGHFKHNEQSLRLVELYGRKGKGLNLTREVRDAIVNHTGSTMPKTLEGQVVRRCDRIAVP